MKCFVLVCLIAFGAVSAYPYEPARASALDLFRWLEKLVDDEEQAVMKSIVHLIHHIEDGLTRVKEIVPKVNKELQDEADRILKELEKLADEVDEALGKKVGKVLYGLGILDDLDDVIGGTKLRTVLKLMKLAESANKVCQDAKDFSPKFDVELIKIEGMISKHAKELFDHVLNKFGMSEDVQLGVAKKISDMLKDLKEEINSLITSVIKNMEDTFLIMEMKLPEVYKVLEKRIQGIRKEMKGILVYVKHENQRSPTYGFLDLAERLTQGTRLGTAIRIVNLIDKFSVVVQDARGFGPHVEILLHRSVRLVFMSAKDFYYRLSQILSKGY